MFATNSVATKQEFEMNTSIANNRKVRARNAGDDFHIAWTACKAIELINPNTELKAIYVEDFPDDDSEGNYVVDIAELYNGTTKEIASKIVICQFKYSPTNPNGNVTASDLRDPVGKFFRKFLKLKDEGIAAKCCFSLITNQPIETTLSLTLVEEAYNNLFITKDKNGKKITNEKKKQKYSKADILEFISSVTLNGNEKFREEINSTICNKISLITGDSNRSLMALIKDEIRERAMPMNSAQITKETILRLLNYNEDMMFPCPPQFSVQHKLIKRDSLKRIIEEIDSSNKDKIIISASGGQGKTIICQQLKEYYEDKGCCVLFDGFAGGGYRTPSCFRYVSSKALSHVINELATKNLCELFLPQNDNHENSISIFKRRVENVCNYLRSENPNNKLIIIFDAADNICMGNSYTNNKECYINSLFREIFPDNCKIIFTCRPERISLLTENNSEYDHIELTGFTVKETEEYMKQYSYFSNKISSDKIKYFHKYTSGNPRVQNYLLGEYNSFEDIKNAISGQMITPEHIIKEKLEKSKTCLTNVGWEKKGIDNLLQIMAYLPAPIPLKTLALLSGKSESEIKSFISDFSNNILILIDNKKIRFLDEPTDTYFQTNFKISSDELGNFFNKIKEYIGNDPYIAMVTPNMMYQLGLYNEIISLALNTDLDFDNEKLKREILLERLDYAFQSCLITKNFQSCIKVMIETFKIVQIEDTYSQQIINNYHIMPYFCGTSEIDNFISRCNDGIDYNLPYKASLILSQDMDSYEGNQMLGKSNEIFKDLLHSKNHNVHLNGMLETISWNVFLYKSDNEFIDYCQQFNEFGRCIIYQNILKRGKYNKKLLDKLSSLMKNDALVGLLFFQNLSCIKNFGVEECVIIADFINANEEFIENIKNQYDSNSKQIQMSIVNFLVHLSYKGYKLLDIEKCLEKSVCLSQNYGIHEKENRLIQLRVFFLLSKQKHIDFSSDFILQYYELDNKTKNKFTQHDYELLFQKQFNIIHDEYLSLYDGIKTDYKKLLSYVAENYYQASHEIKELSIELLCIGLKTISTDELDTISRLLRDKGHTYLLLKILETIVTQEIRKLYDFLYVLGNHLKIMLDNETDANEKTSKLINVAEAFVAIGDQDEANIYFRYSQESMKLLNDNAYNNFELFTNFADQLSLSSQASHEDVFNLVRISKFFCQHNDHKFPWFDVFSTAAKMSPTYSLALLNRLSENDLISLARVLPSWALALYEDEKISKDILIALKAFGGWYDLENNISSLFVNKDSRNYHRMKFIIDDIEAGLSDEKNIYKRLNNINEKYKINFPFIPSENENDDFDNKPLWDMNGEIKQIPQFDRSLGYSDETFSDYLQLCHNQAIHITPEEILVSYLADIEIKDINHVVSIPLRYIKELVSISNVLSGYKFIKNKYPHKESLTQIFFSLFETNIALFSELFNYPYSLEENIVLLSDLTGKPQQELFLSIINNGCLKISRLSSSCLVGLIDKMTKIVNVDIKALYNESIDYINQLIPSSLYTDNWSEKMDYNSNINQTIAMFIYVRLGNQSCEMRWKAVHAIIRLVTLGEEKIISELIKLYGTINVSPFIPDNYPFYNWNAKLWLILALQCACAKNKQLMLIYEEFFLSEVHSTNHTLIKEYCRIALEILNPKYKKELQGINKSKLKRQSYSNIDTDPYHVVEHEYLPYDFQYQLIPLASLFGKNLSEICSLVIKWANSEDKLDIKAYYNSDPRYPLYDNSDKTWSHKGTLPEVETYRYYLSFHGMFMIAQDLLLSVPLNSDCYYNWRRDVIEDYTNVRGDGRLLYDLKDYEPKSIKKIRMESGDKDWLYSVVSNYFTKLLLSHDNKIPLYEDYYIKNAYGTEIVKIKSAFIAPQNSSKILAKAQKNVDDFFISVDGNQYNNNKSLQKIFKISISKKSNFEKFDFYTGNIQYPMISLSNFMNKIFSNLTLKDNKYWYLGDDMVVSSAIWDKVVYAREYSSGSMLLFDKKFIQQMIVTTKHNILLSVDIYRTTDNDEHSSNHKFFVLKDDGCLYDLYQKIKVL